MSTVKALSKKRPVKASSIQKPLSQNTKAVVLVEMPRDIQAAVSEILKRRGLVN